MCMGVKMWFKQVILSFSNALGGAFDQFYLSMNKLYVDK